MPQIRPYAMGLLLLVAGCAGPMGTLHGATTSSSVTSYDGSYQNTIHVTSVAAGVGESNWCDTPGQPIITVANGQFSYVVPHPNVPGNLTPTFVASLAADGSFSNQSVDGIISGQVHGTHIDGTISGLGCVYGFSGDRT